MSEEISREDLTAAIADHLALRQKNAALEGAMPLRDYLPNDYVRIEEPTNNGAATPIRQWFDLEDDGGLDWAA